MWLLFVFIYIILSIIFTQSYKITAKCATSDGALTVLLQLIAGTSVLLFSPFFKFTLPSDFKVYLLLICACIFYTIAYRLNTTVRKNLEASTVSIIKQISTVFMILSGLLFFKEPFVLKKFIGAIMIIFSNILIFYKKGNQKLNKCIILGIIASIAYSIALFLDINNSNNFNLAFYISLTLILPSIFTIIVERINFKSIKNEFSKDNKTKILITSGCWGLMILLLLKAYQLGETTSVAPLCTLTVLGNVIVGYLFLNERNNLLKKVIAAILIIISIILIKG